MANKFSINVEDNQIAIYIDGFVHLMFRKDRFLGLQSWRIGNAYRIEFYLIGGDIRAEYETKEKWLKVLGLLNRRDLCVGADE